MRHPIRSALVVLAAILVLAGGLAAQSTESAAALLRAAIDQATVDGDLKGAIKQYQAIVQKFPADRGAVATALVRMGECYRKLGDAQARHVYERVIREFNDQKEAAAEARARLATLNRASGPAQPSEPVVRRVWSGPEVDLLVAPSPDGRYLTYVDWGTGDLAVREISTGESRHLTNKGSWSASSEFAVTSTIAPDAMQVAYNWFGHPPNDPKGWGWSLRLVGLDGGEPRILYSNSELQYLHPMTWSPDGKQILVLVTERDGTYRLALLQVGSGTLRVLKTLDWRWPGRTTFSPDGRYVVYDFPPQENSSSRDLFLLATDGSRELVLAKHPADDIALGWVPHSKSVLFASNRAGTMDTWIVQVEDGKPVGEPELVKKDIGRIDPLGFSNKGAFYYALPTGMQEVYVAAFDQATGRLSAPAAPATQRSVGSNSDPFWSPDGRLLAFISGRKRMRSGLIRDFDTRLVIRSIDSGEERELFPKVTTLYGPRWSPDGRSIIARAYDRKGRQDIYAIDVLTGDATSMVQGEGYDPVLSPDGKTLFYRRNTTSIIARDLEKGREIEVHRGFVRSLSLSPDGRSLAFSSLVEKSQGICIKVVAVSGGEARVMAQWQEEQHPTVTWEPDGRHVIAATRAGLWRIPADGRPAQKIETDIKGARDVAVSPDGRRLAFTAGESKAEVWVMENFLAVQTPPAGPRRVARP